LAVAPATPLEPIVFDGRNPLVSDVNAHLGPDERYFVEVRDLVFRANRRIQKRNGKSVIGGNAGARITAMHAFTHYDSSGNPTHMKYRTFGTAIQAASGTLWGSMTLPYSPTSAAPWVFANHGGRVFAVNGKEAMIVSNGLAADAWREVGQVAPAVAPAYSLTANDAPVTNTTTGTTVSCTKGSAVVNCTGASFTTGTSWVGKRITIDGRNYEIAAVGATNQLTLNEGFKEETSAGLSWRVYRGIGDWEEGPQYAFAYYNPTTGHVSNISPILQVTEKKQVGRTVTVTIAASAAHQSAYQAGYTKIQLFRTPLNGAQLVALNEQLNNVNSAVTTITYVETATKFADTYLTKLPAEQTIRRKPVDAAGNPLKFVAVASYKGRLWAITRNRLYWCASTDEVPLWGVGEECWPAQFSREIPEAFGLVVIGQEGYNDRLVIITADGDYTIEGYDNRDIEVFPLRKRPSGGFAGGATVADGRLVELYRDRRLIDSQYGDLAAQVQNRFNDIPASLTTACRLHWFALNQRDILIASIPGSSASVDVDTLMVVDFTLQRWSEFVISGITAFATVKDANGSLELWVGDASGNTWCISYPGIWTDNGSNFAPQLKTCVMRFGRQVRLSHAQAFISDAAQTWTLKMFLNEQTSEAATDKSYKAVTLAAARHQSQSAQGRELVWVPTLKDRVSAEAFQFALVCPSTNTDLYIDKLVFTFAEVEPGAQQ
jgi:hypothetical protein